MAALGSVVCFELKCRKQNKDGDNKTSTSIDTRAFVRERGRGREREVERGRERGGERF